MDVPSEASVGIARELLRWCQDEDLVRVRPELVDDVAGAMALPGPALALAHRVQGLSAPEISDRFVCPQWVVLTRLAQIGSPVGSGEYSVRFARRA